MPRQASRCYIQDEIIDVGDWCLATLIPKGENLNSTVLAMKVDHIMATDRGWSVRDGKPALCGYSGQYWLDGKHQGRGSTGLFSPLYKIHDSETIAFLEEWHKRDFGDFVRRHEPCIDPEPPAIKKF